MIGHACTITSIPSDFVGQVEFIEGILGDDGERSETGIDEGAIEFDLTTPSQTQNARYEILLPWQDIKSWSEIKAQLETLRNNLSASKGAKSLLSYFKKRFSFLHSVDISGLEEAVLVMCRTRNMDSSYIYGTVILSIVDLSLKGPELFRVGSCVLPALNPSSNAALTLTGDQCACLLSHAFLNTFSPRTRLRTRDFFAADRGVVERCRFGFFTFRNLLTKVSCAHKLACILEYFSDRFSDPISHSITFYRACLAEDKRAMEKALETGGGPLAAVALTSACQIEHFLSCVQADFANSLVGGGVLRKGCVQEEIMFCTRPELITAVLFTPRLQPHECLHIVGARQYSAFEGYSTSFRYMGPFSKNPQTPMDAKGRFRLNVVAIDALRFTTKSSNNEQLDKANIDRDILKAVCGFAQAAKFQNAPSNAVASGNWGCGAFGGNVQLKFIIQLLAATITNRKLIYCTFQNQELATNIAQFYQNVQGTTAIKLYNSVCQIGQQNKTAIFDSVLKYLNI